MANVNNPQNAPQHIDHCDVTLKSIQKQSHQEINNRFKMSSTLHDVVQFVKSQNLTKTIAFFQVDQEDHSFDNFDISLQEICEIISGNKKDKNITSISLIIVDNDYIQWEKHIILSNILFRYKLGIISKDPKTSSYFPSIKVYNHELRKKCEALAQRTILENFELREVVNEERDDSFHLRNEIYELAGKLERQAIQIKSLSKALKLPDFEPLIGNLHNVDAIDSLYDAIAQSSVIYTQSRQQRIVHNISRDDVLVNHAVMKYNLMEDAEQGLNEEMSVEIMAKAMTLVQQTCAENAELRGEVDELRDENFWLRNIIYSQQDQINRFVLLINKLEKGLAGKTSVTMKDVDGKIMSQELPSGNTGKEEKKEYFDLYDWKEWNETAVVFSNGYIRKCFEQEFQMIIPKEINVFIANYVVYVLCVMMQ